MSSLSIEEAQSRLPELIHQLKPGDEVVLTENNRPVARLIAGALPQSVARQPGSARGVLVINADDDEHLADFRDHMP